MIDQTGITPLPDKVQVISDFPQPTTLQQLRRYLRLVNYYRQFIPKCSQILVPLTDLLRGQGRRNTTIQLTDETLAAFRKSREALVNFTKLSYVNDDNSTHLSLTTDISSDAIEAMLHQHVHDNTEPISFFSVKLTLTQKHTALSPASCLQFTYLLKTSDAYWKEGTLLYSQIINL